MNRFFFFFIISFSFFGCKNGAKKDFVVSYVEGNYVDTILIPHKLSIDILNPTAIVSIDTFLIMLQRHEQDMLRVYSTRSEQFLGAFLRKGNGPDEVVLFNRLNQYEMEGNDAKLWIQSFGIYMGLLNVNESLKQNKTVFDKKYSFENTRKNIFLESNVVFNLDSSTFLMAKDPMRSGEFEKNPNPFFVKYNYTTESVLDTIYFHDFKNVSWEDNLLFSSYKVIKPDKSKVAFFLSYMEAFTIIDLKTGYKFEYGLTSSGLDPRLAISRKSTVHNEACATETLVFALRRGEEKENSFLYAYDWNGNEKYKFDLNAHILFFSVNEKLKTLYCIDTEDQILKYDLQDFM